MQLHSWIFITKFANSCKVWYYSAVGRLSGIKYGLLVQSSVVAAGCISAFYLLQGAGLLSTTGRSNSALEYSRSSDPNLGTVFELPRTDVWGRKIDAPQKILVIAGSCLGCSLDALDPRTVVPRPGEMYVFAYQMPAKDLPSWLSKIPQVRYVSDEDEKLKTRANAPWQPRFLLLGPDNALNAISQQVGVLPSWVSVKGEKK